MMKTNADTNNSELTSILNHHFKGIVNLARLKLIVHFVIALCKLQTVTFNKLANAFDTKSSAKSSLYRSLDKPTLLFLCLALFIKESPFLYYLPR